MALFVWLLWLDFLKNMFEIVVRLPLFPFPSREYCPPLPSEYSTESNTVICHWWGECDARWGWGEGAPLGQWGERERVEGMGWWNFNIWNPKWTFNSKFSFGKTFHSYKPNRVNVFWSKDSKLPNIPLRKWASKLQGSCKLSKGPWRKEAIKSETDSILQNHRWKLVDPPSGCKKKMKADGSIARQELWQGYIHECLDYFDM